MANISKRSGKYAVRVRMSGHDQSKTFRTLAEAKAWAAQTETEINNRLLGIIPKDLTLGDLVRRYLAEVTPSKRGSRSESLRLGRMLRHNICTIAAAELRPHHLASWRDDRLKQVQAPSVARELTTLSSVLNYAMREWGLLHDNPARKISRPKHNDARTRRPSEDEIRRLCAWLEYDDNTPPRMMKQRVALAFLFAIETAMRAGEICNIQWAEVDFTRRVVHLPKTKNGNSRDVPLSRRAIALLHKLDGIDMPYGAFGLSPEPLSSMFRRATRACEIDNLHFHDSRREALTRMSKKVNVMDLAKISGHKDVKILLNTYYAPDAASLADLLD